MDKFVIKLKTGDTEDQNSNSDNSANKVPKTDSCERYKSEAFRT